MKKHVLISDCPRCKNIPSYTYVNFLGGDSLTPELEALVGDTRGVDVFERVIQCPVCGTYYMNTNECGFMENDMEVRRISPTEAGETVTAEDLAWFKEQLKHPSPQVREYAALCLHDFEETVKTIKNLNKTS